MNRFGKSLSAVLCAAVLLSALSACADTFWEARWKPGEYAVAFTPEEDARYTEIMETAARQSEGTGARTEADQETPEVQYERFTGMYPDGNPVVYDDVEYEDIGYYKWAAGLPDDQSEPETLKHYYPHASYETGSDPENPAWHILLECYDYEESGLPVTAWSVAVYAHDGSVCGYREVNGAG